MVKHVSAQSYLTMATDITTCHHHHDILRVTFVASRRLRDMLVTLVTIQDSTALDTVLHL